jgi:hypothetical protein
VPVVVLGEALPVDVLDAEPGCVVTVEPSGVVDVEDPDVAPGADDGVPAELEVEISVGDVEGPPVAAEVPLSDGAVGLAPPLPAAVEMPPVARTLTLTGVIVVVEVKVDAGESGLRDALAESPLATPAGDWVRATSGDDGALGPGLAASTPGVVRRWDAAGATGATLTTRA